MMFFLSRTFRPISGNQLISPNFSLLILTYPQTDKADVCQFLDEQITSVLKAVWLGAKITGPPSVLGSKGRSST